MRHYGSQIRETLEEAGYSLGWGSRENGEVVLRNESGELELWCEKDDNPGWTIEIDGKGYEFVRSIREDEE